MPLVRKPLVLVSDSHAQRRVEVYLFSDDADGPWHVLMFSGGEHRLPSVDKAQGPIPSPGNADFVAQRIVAELLEMGYRELPPSQAVWEVYARTYHKRIVTERNERVDYDGEE